MQPDSPDIYSMFPDAGHGKDDVLAFLDWSSFESDAPHEDDMNGHPFNQDHHHDGNQSASAWPPSRLSGDSSACGWDENSPTTGNHNSERGNNSTNGGPQSMPAQPPSAQPQQQQQQHQQGGFDSAWAAAQAPQSFSWPCGPSLAVPPPLSVEASWVPPPASNLAPSHQMSWSLGRGLLHPTPHRLSVPSSDSHHPSGGASHPLSGQLSGTYPSSNDLATHPQPEPSWHCGKVTGANSSPFFTQPPPAPFLMAAYPSQQQQHQQQQLQQMLAPAPLYRSSSGAGSANLVSPTAVLRQLTEDELRRHVQQQVMALIQCEKDLAQLGWLHELLEMTKTSTLALLGTLRQQLDVLLQPSKVSEQQQLQLPPPSAQAAAVSVYSDDWQSIIQQAANGGTTSHPLAIADGGGCLNAALDSWQTSGDPSRRSHGQQQLAPSPRANHNNNFYPSSASPSSQHQARRQSMASSLGGGGAAPSQSPRGTCGGGASSSGMVPTDEIGSHGSFSNRKRPAESEGEVERRVKVEPSPSGTPLMTSPHGGGGGGHGMHYEPRWWRKQNNFTMTIDDIVKKMHSQGRLGPNASAWQPTSSVAAAQPAESSELSGGADCEGRHINADRVRQVYDRPLKEAAKLLFVSVMSLKRTCRKMGVRRWPYRKLASLSELEVTVRDDQLEQQLQPCDKTAVMQYIEAEKAAIMVEPDRDVDPLLSDLRKAKIHMKYEKWGRKSLGRGTSNATSQAVSVGALGGFDGAGFDGADDLM